MYGKGVDGYLHLGAGAGDIVNGGDVAFGSTIRVAMYSPDCQNPNRFSGTATFDDVVGEIAALDANVDGLIHITGYLNEQIAIAQGLCSPGETGHLLPDGKIWVEGNAVFGVSVLIMGDTQGEIQIDGSLTGLALLERDLSGTITVGGDLSGGIDIGGNTSGDINIDAVTGAGTIDIAGAVTGDIQVANDMDGTIAIAGALGALGRILIGGLCDGGITIGAPGASTALIRILEGIDDNGSITITVPTL